MVVTAGYTQAMMIPLLALAFLLLPLPGSAADPPVSGPIETRTKKRAKSAPQSPAAVPGARVERRKPGYETPGGAVTSGGDGVISNGGEALPGGAGISRGAADKKPAANAGSGSSSGGGGGGGAGGGAAAPSKSFEKAKLSVSVSPTGPWVQNGEVCNTGKVYSRTTGLDRTKPPKGCASPFASKDCLDVTKHRAFLPNEWVDPFTIQTVINGPDYPAGKYGIYLSDSKNAIKQVGFATLKTCAPPPPPAAPPAPAGCRWETNEPVIGPCGGPGCSGNVPCSMANRGAQGAGGGGTWTCICR